MKNNFRVNVPEHLRIVVQTWVTELGTIRGRNNALNLNTGSDTFELNGQQYQLQLIEETGVIAWGIIGTLKKFVIACVGEGERREHTVKIGVDFVGQEENVLLTRGGKLVVLFIYLSIF